MRGLNGASRLPREAVTAFSAGQPAFYFHVVCGSAGLVD